MPAPHTYVRYADGVEEIQPDEQQLIDDTVASMSRLNRFMFEKHRHAIRDAHAKSHGVLRGELHIYPNLPAHLARGLFREITGPTVRSGSPAKSWLTKKAWLP
jgi:hypothetical protein